MDIDARESCLRAIRIVARNARLCAVTDRDSRQYFAAIESCQRVLVRAQSYHETMRREHAPHERVVRQVTTALVEARQCALALAGRLADPEDLEAMAGKIERATARAGLKEEPGAAT